MRRLALAFLLPLAGCMTTQVSEALSGFPAGGGHRQRLTVEVRNTGWYFFDLIPIVCGNPERPDEISCRFFSDTLTLQNNLSVLSRVLAREKATVLGSVTSYEEGEGFLTFVVTRQSYHTSATILQDRPRVGGAK
jgi:hypothetical protein